MADTSASDTAQGSTGSSTVYQVVLLNGLITASEIKAVSSTTIDSSKALHTSAVGSELVNLVVFAQAWNIAHVKDAEMIHGKRESVSLAELFGLAKQAGYRGYYSMESDSERDPYPDTKHLIEQTLKFI